MHEYDLGNTDMNANHTAIPQALITALQQARHVVVFTGARVSAESGFPTFREAQIDQGERFDVKVWGNGADIDNPILACVLAAVELK